ncbi:hypothetical protein BLA29_008724, partial [Euroglyphus maynei]
MVGGILASNEQSLPYRIFTGKSSTPPQSTKSSAPQSTRSSFEEHSVSSTSSSSSSSSSAYPPNNKDIRSFINETLNKPSDTISVKSISRESSQDPSGSSSNLLSINLEPIIKEPSQQPVKTPSTSITKLNDNSTISIGEISTTSLPTVGTTTTHAAPSVTSPLELNLSSLNIHSSPPSATSTSSIQPLIDNGEFASIQRQHSTPDSPEGYQLPVFPKPRHHQQPQQIQPPPKPIVCAKSRKSLTPSTKVISLNDFELIAVLGR